MHYKAEQERNSLNSVRLNSIVTVRCQNTGVDEKVYETFKIMDNPGDDRVYKCVSLNSKIGKALLGGIKGQKVSIEGCDSAIIVKIVNDSICRKVGKDSIVEIELYKDYACTEFIESRVLGYGDDIRDGINNREVSSVVKIYYPRRRPEFAKIIRIVSHREVQIDKRGKCKSQLG